MELSDKQWLALKQLDGLTLAYYKQLPHSEITSDFAKSYAMAVVALLTKYGEEIPIKCLVENLSTRLILKQDALLIRAHVREP